MSAFEKYGTWAEIIYHTGCVISTAIVCHSQQENHVNEAITCQVMMGIFAEAIHLSLLLCSDPNHALSPPWFADPVCSQLHKPHTASHGDPRQGLQDTCPSSTSCPLVTQCS